MNKLVVVSLYYKKTKINAGKSRVFSSKEVLNKQTSIERHYMAEFTPF